MSPSHKGQNLFLKYAAARKGSNNDGVNGESTTHVRVRSPTKGIPSTAQNIAGPKRPEPRLKEVEC